MTRIEAENEVQVTFDLPVDGDISSTFLKATAEATKMRRSGYRIGRVTLVFVRPVQVQQVEG